MNHIILTCTVLAFSKKEGKSRLEITLFTFTIPLQVESHYYYSHHHPNMQYKNLVSFLIVILDHNQNDLGPDQEAEPDQAKIST